MPSLDTQELYRSEKLISCALQQGDQDTLYQVIPKLFDYFRSSENFKNETNDFLKENIAIPEMQNLKRNFSLATQKMEGYAQPAFIKELSRRSEEEKIEFIRDLGNPATIPYSPQIEFERISELYAERIQSNIDENSTVLILGAGSISISGLYLASWGANVRLLDRDPEAFENFQKLYPHLPNKVQENLVLEEACDARDFKYPDNLTHILIAGLLEPKNPVLELLQNYYNQNPGLKKPKILMRIPKENLFQLFYYETDGPIMEGFKTTSVVDIGYEQPTYTYILEIE